jgi:ubiquinone/menaquinone biosynthesis C-methylase UbiE
MSRLQMNAVNVFDECAQEYDRWFDAHEHVYQSEVDAVRRFIPARGIGIEIGVGTGRFAVPCGVRIGIDPSESMERIAKSRGMAVCRAVESACLLETISSIACCSSQ